MWLVCGCQSSSSRPRLDSQRSSSSRDVISTMTLKTEKAGLRPAVWSHIKGGGRPPVVRCLSVPSCCLSCLLLQLMWGSAHKVFLSETTLKGVR